MRWLPALIACLLGCGENKDAGPPPPPPLPAVPVPVDLGQEPIVNPLNLWEMMIDGGPDHETVGVIGTQRVTTRELDEASDKLLTRIGDRIYLARDRGWRAILEQEGLARAAAAQRQRVEALLTAAYRGMRPPTAAELEAELARAELAELPPSARAEGARSLWRLERWLVRRSMLIEDGLRGVPRERAQLMLVNPDFAPPTTSIGKIGDRRVSRAELHLAAGYEEQVGRREYFEAARMLFEQRARGVVLAEAAAAAKITIEELEARELARLGPPPTDEVARFVAENPAYASEPERAVDAVRTLRGVAAKDALVARLVAKAGGARFLLIEPPFDPIAPAALHPRLAGTPAAADRIEALHCVGGDTCAQGSALVRSIVRTYGGRVRIELGDYFAGLDVTRLRHAVALRCADEQQQGWPMLERLLDDPAAGPRGLDLDEPRFRACLAEDRHLELVVENKLRAEQLGLDMNVAGIWVNGWRLDGLGDPAHVTATIDRLLKP